MPTHTLRNHRIGAGVALGVAAIVGGLGAAGAASLSYQDWSIEEFQVDATLEGDTLSMVETIDFDFNLKSGRGVFQEVDLGVVDRAEQVRLDNVTAASASANEEIQVTEVGSNATIRIGDPDQTFNGPHRYQLGYDLVGVPDPTETGRLVFIAVGDRWEVPIDNTTIRLATDFEPGDVTCSIGSSGSFDPCDVTTEDGVVTATVDELDPGEGVALTVESGPPRTPATLETPSLELDGAGDNPLGTVILIGLVTAVTGVIGALVTGRWVRRAGADITGSVANPSEAAYTTQGDGARIDDRTAAEQVTIQFAPPEGLTPPQGAVLVRERIDDGAKTAWLAQAMIDGWIELDGDPQSPTVSHADRANRDPSHMPAPLAAIFDGRQEVTLGTYDKGFAAGWKAVGNQLESWKSSSGLWDEERRRRNLQKTAPLFVLGLLAAAIAGGLLIAGLGRAPLVAVPVVAGAGLLFGSGLRALAGTPTLEVRNPAGFGLWLRAEGFRRFLSESEGEHARWAADNGLLREYSAWAVALGELDRWNQAAAAAGIPPTDPGLAATTSIVALHSTATTTSSQPSSGSSGGGFSGGGFSGGVGGGGGGGW